MRISSLSIEGFRNIRTRVQLEQIPRVAVIHGDNNVGKSNVLAALTLLGRATGMPHDQAHPADQWQHRVGLVPADIFPLGEVNATASIGIVAEWSPSDAEWFRAQGVDPSAVPHELLVKFSKTDQTIAWTPQPSRDGRFNPGNIHIGLKALSRLASPHLVTVVPPVPTGSAIQLVQTSRLADLESGDPRAVIPQSLKLRLLDARESEDKSRYERWELFAETMRSVAGDANGTFIPRYNRQDGVAELLFETPQGRLAVERLGSGIRQLIALLARILLTPATVVAIEEPELNLRYDLQLRLRDAFERIVSDGRGPEQILLTSHSPAFESGRFFYWMRPGADGPTVERHTVADAAQITGPMVPPLNAETTAPFGYITTEGLIRLTKESLDALGLPSGGGVMINHVPARRLIELHETSRFFDELEEHAAE